MNTTRWGWFVCSFLLLVLFLVPSSFASDPVTTFIVHADSIANIPDDAAFERFVGDNAILVGAVVGQLIDVAVQIAGDGQAEAAEENFEFARRIAAVHEQLSGSAAPGRLIDIYTCWDDAARQTRRIAKALEQLATVLAVLWGTLGIAYWYAGDFEGVMHQYDNALAARRAIEDRIYEGKTLNGLGSANYQLGDFEAARDYYEQAVDLRTRTGDIDGLATSLTYLGNVHLATGRIVDARNTFEKALPIVEQTGKTDKLFELHTSIAGLNAEMGRLEASNDAYTRALELAQSLDDPARQVICHNNLALNYADAYRYGEALTELEASRSLLDRHPDPERAIAYHRNSGIVHMGIGEIETARDEFLELLRLSEEHEMPRFQLEALVNLGYLLQQLGAFDQGLDYARRAKTLADEIQNPLLGRESMILAAQLEQHIGRYDDAVRIWEQLLEQDHADSIDTNIAADRLGLANTLAVAGRIEEAREIFATASPMVQRSQDGDLILALNFGLGHSFENTNPDSAFYYYERALGLLDETREQIGGAGMRTGYLGGVRRFYFEEVARYYAGRAARSDPTAADVWSARAFKTIEKAKARGLLDLVEASVLGHHTSAEEAMLDSLHALDPNSAGYAARKNDLEDLYARTREERVASSVGESFAVSVIVGPEDVREILPKRTALLAYALGDTTSLLWVIDKDGVALYELPARSELRPLIARLRDAVIQPGTADDALRQTARRLYGLLVESAADRIETAEGLIIVPDGALFEVPFEILLTEDPESGAGWDELPYLAKSQCITYTPSASVYLTLRNTKKPQKFSKDLFAMG
ncbi:MAG: tetratricopeptide repeat protein, partial [bacterium]